MADAERLKCEKLSKLVEELRKVQARTFEITEQIQAILADTPTPGAQANAALQAFREGWKRKYGGDYVLAWGKDQASMKRVLKFVPLDELIPRIARYFADDEPFVTRSKHALGIFLATVSRYQPGPMKTIEPAVGCQHDPPCGTDAEHTKRRMRELRF